MNFYKTITTIISIIMFNGVVQVQASETNAGQNSKNKPNLIVILTDDQGYKDVGFNGSTDIKTPFIDVIANEGTIFTNGYVTFPVCGPSRAGLLTGRYQGRFGFTSNPSPAPDADVGLPSSEKTIAEVLKPAGYTSGILGKWHMGGHADYHPNNRGFDYFFGFVEGGHRYFPEELTITDFSEVTKWSGWYYTKLMRNQERIETTEYLTDELSNEAVKFIEREKDNPFFLFVSYNAPHAPLQATEKYLNRYKHIKDKKRQTYAAMVSAVDDGVGEILKTLEKQGIDDNTIVFFLSDNGGPETKNASDNGELREGKGSLFEGGVRVPFAMRWPEKIPQGQVYTNAVSSLDILATIVGQADVDTSKNKPLDGVDLTPYLTGENDGLPHDALYWRHLRKDGQAVIANHNKMINLKNKKFLYDVANDVGETESLGSDNDTYKELNAGYQEWLKEMKPTAFVTLLEYKKIWLKQQKSKKNKNKKTKP
ncbi:sulfatase-like hydrolase/transferase [Thalassotalea crassostreae]|uniref:sulfatase-like hydrolase/transferase n=1 Tax=Thalassotalea crassostreae TaxID=1763536 RepID=UPI000837B4C4|nr:sulfatase-like hydrolase/transferase [Thalassotalea crassostreae]